MFSLPQGVNLTRQTWVGLPSGSLHVWLAEAMKHPLGVPKMQQQHNEVFFIVVFRFLAVQQRNRWPQEWRGLRLLSRCQGLPQR